MAGELTVLAWKWGRKYSRDHVINLEAALKRHLHMPHRLVVVGDDPQSLPMPVAPRGTVKEAIRLWMFSSEAAAVLGERVLNIDIDMVIIDDITPLIDRPEPFVIWRSDSFGRHGYALNPSLILFDAGRYDLIWRAFKRDAAGMLETARREGWTGTEQAVIGHWFYGCDIPVWTEADGIVSFRLLADKAQLPAGTRIVSFHGAHDPAKAVQIPWVAANWMTVKEPT